MDIYILLHFLTPFHQKCHQQEDILYPGDIHNLPEYKAQPDLSTYIQETTKVPEAKTPSRMKAFWDTFLSMTNIHVLNDNKMRIISLVSIKNSMKIINI